MAMDVRNRTPWAICPSPKPTPRKASPLPMESRHPILQTSATLDALSRCTAAIFATATLGNKWMVWDGRRWREDDTAEVYRRARHTVREMYRQAKNLLAEAEGEDKRKSAKRKLLSPKP